MSFSRLESHSEWGDAYALRGKVVLKWGIHAPYPCSFGGIHKLMKWNSWKIQPHYLDCIFPLKNDYFCRSRIIEFVSIKHIYDITSQQARLLKLHKTSLIFSPSKPLKTVIRTLEIALHETSAFLPMFYTECDFESLTLLYFSSEHVFLSINPRTDPTVHVESGQPRREETDTHIVLNTYFCWPKITFGFWATHVSLLNYSHQNPKCFFKITKYLNAQKIKQTPTDLLTRSTDVSLPNSPLSLHVLFSQVSHILYFHSHIITLSRVTDSIIIY